MLLVEDKMVVITKHNSVEYFINDIDFKGSPKTHTFEWVYLNPETKEKENLTTDMMEYFKLKWNTQIDERDEGQPLLVVNRGGVKILLPSSLCYDSALPKDFTKDARRVRAI